MAIEYNRQKHPLAVQTLEKAIYAIGPTKDYDADLDGLFRDEAKKNGIAAYHIQYEWFLFIVPAENHVAMISRVKFVKDLVEDNGGIANIDEKDLYPLRII